MFKEIFQIQTSEICDNIIVRKDEACPSKISHKFHKQCLFHFLQNVRPNLVVSKYPPKESKQFDVITLNSDNSFPYLT